ncbi:MAG: hypothetical protein PVI06_00400 [Desulfobacterales bacterium]
MDVWSCPTGHFTVDLHSTLQCPLLESKTDRIKIKGIEIEPKPTKQDFQQREGVMQRDIELKPKAVAELKLKFFVKHPRGNSALRLKSAMDLRWNRCRIRE